MRIARWLGFMLILAGCGSPSYPPLPQLQHAVDAPYLVGPGDTLSIVVWRSPELSMVVPVRPDGKITTPLVEDLQRYLSSATCSAIALWPTVGCPTELTNCD